MDVFMIISFQRTETYLWRAKWWSWSTCKKKI